MKEKDWLIALSAAAAGLSAVSAVAQERVGVTSAVTETTRGQIPGGETRTIFVGSDMFFHENVSTNQNGQAQILFLDQSALTVGPNSELVIDEFVYDPNRNAGRLALNVGKGIARFVGGALSKNEGQVRLKTPQATIGIRGGIIVLAVDPATQKTEAVFLFGDQMTVTSNGSTITIYRPGFGTTVIGNTIGNPVRWPDSKLNQFLSELESKRNEQLKDLESRKNLAELINSRLGANTLGLAPFGNAGVLTTLGNLQQIEQHIDLHGAYQQQQRDDIHHHFIPPPPPPPEFGC